MGNELDQLIAQIETEAIALIAVARYVLAKRAVEYNVRDIDLVIIEIEQVWGRCLEVHLTQAPAKEDATDDASA